MRTYRQKKYESLGFVEALIALTVTGIVGIVLMSIAASALNELRMLDTRDEIEYYAISTAVEMQKAAIEYALDDPGANDFLSLDTGSCYGFDDLGKIDPLNPLDGRGAFTGSEIPETPYFRVFCVISTPASGQRRLVGRIIVGDTNMRGVATSKTDIRDYQHIVVINI